MQSVDAAGLPIGDEHPPRIMGVLNVSPESPYDPSVHADPGEAAAYVDSELLSEGADIVDVGLSTANKAVEALSADAELDRLETAIEAIASTSGDPVFSIETRYAAVADAALAAGFDMVNDVCGFADPAMPTVCREHDAPVVKMASPTDLRHPGAVEREFESVADEPTGADLLADRTEGFRDRTERADDTEDGDSLDTDGTVKRAGETVTRGRQDYVDAIYAALERGGFTEKTIIDPAFGVWSERGHVEDDRATFRRLREFRALDRPILVSINRKDFLRDVAGRHTEAALPVSLAATAMAVERGAHVIRTHDVAETRDAALVGATFARKRYRTSGEPGVEELDVTTAREAVRYLDRIGADADPEAAVARVLELRGLAPEERRTIAQHAPVHGVAFASGGGERALVAGTEAALRRFAGAIDEGEVDSTVLGAVAGAIRAAID